MNTMGYMQSKRYKSHTCNQYLVQVVFSILLMQSVYVFKILVMEQKHVFYVYDDANPLYENRGIGLHS